MKVWLVDRWIEMPAPSVLPLKGVLLDVAYSATLKEQFASSTRQQPVTQVLKELQSKPELVFKWGKFLIEEGPQSTLKKIAARLDDVHVAFLRACCSVSGKIEAVGNSVRTVKPGDRVAALGFRVPTHAEFMVVPEELCVKLPDNIPEDQAAFILPGAMALYAVERLLNQDGSGPVAVLGATSWGIIAAKELQERGEEVVLYQIAHPEFLEHFTGNGQGRNCVIIHGNTDRCQQAIAAGWVLENIRLPDPATEERLNLDIYSDDPLNLPPWAQRDYLNGFIDRLVHKRLQLAEPSARVENYASQRGRCRSINYDQTSKSRENCLYNPAPQPADSRQKLGISVIGAGNFSIDMEPYQSYYVSKYYGFDYFSTDPESVFGDQRTNCVFIVTYHDSHAPLTIDALKEGKTVYLEKPPVVSYQQLTDLTQAIKTYNKYLIVGYNRRFAPAIRAFRHLLTDAEGPANIFYNVRSWYVTPNNWYYWSKEGTRICGNLCHFIDLCYLLTGRQQPVSVSVTPSIVGRPDQNYVATIGFQDGSLGNIIYSARGNNRPEGEERINFQKDRLTVIVEDWQRMYARQDGKVVARWSAKKRDQGHDNEHHDSLQDLLFNRPSPYTLKDLVVTSLTMLKAKEAMESKKTISITEEEINSYL
jgi:predicted dehydrogenase